MDCYSCDAEHFQYGAVEADVFLWASGKDRNVAEIYGTESHLTVERVTSTLCWNLPRTVCNPNVYGWTEKGSDGM